MTIQVEIEPHEYELVKASRKWKPRDEIRITVDAKRGILAILREQKDKQVIYMKPKKRKVVVK